MASLSDHPSSTPDPIVPSPPQGKRPVAPKYVEEAPTHVDLPVLAAERVSYGSASGVAQRLTSGRTPGYQTSHAAELFSLGVDGVAKLLIAAVDNRDVALVSRILENVPSGKVETLQREGGQILRAIGECLTKRLVGEPVKAVAVVDILLSDRSAAVFIHGLTISREIIRTSPIEARKDLIVAVAIRCSLWPTRPFDLGDAYDAVYCTTLTGIIRDIAPQPKSPRRASRHEVDPTAPSRMAAYGLLEHLPTRVAIVECVAVLAKPNSDQVTAIALARLAMYSRRWESKPPIEVLEHIGVFQENLGNRHDDCAENALTILIACGEYGKKGVAMARELVDQPRVFYRAVKELPVISARVADKGFEQFKSDLTKQPRLPRYAGDIVGILAKSGPRGARYLHQIAVEANAATAVVVIDALAKSDVWSSDLAEVTLICMQKSGETGMHHGLVALETEGHLAKSVRFLEAIAIQEDVTAAEKAFYVDVISKLGVAAAGAAFSFSLGQSVESVRIDALKLAVQYSSHLSPKEILALTLWALDSTHPETRRMGLQLARDCADDRGTLYKKLRSIERSDPEPSNRQEAREVLDSFAPKSILELRTWPRALWQAIGFR